jgi:hypothetical protein
MVTCPQCKHSFTESDQPCKKCNGARFEKKPIYKQMTAALKAAGVTERQVIGEKEVICSRCNGAGTELAAKNRNNRKRGASNEYKAVDTFQAWWLKPDGTEYEWRKTPQSGGSALAEGFDMAGDICTTAKDWPFHVECKRTEDWDLGQLILKGSTPYGKMEEYLDQVISDVPKVGGGEFNVSWTKVPLLWLMHPGPSQPVYVMLVQPLCDADVLRSQTGMFHGTIHGVHNVRYHIMALKSFLATDPGTWRILAAKMLDFER